MLMLKGCEPKESPMTRETIRQRLLRLVDESERQLEAVLSPQELAEYRYQKQLAIEMARRTRSGRWTNLRQLYKQGC